MVAVPLCHQWMTTQQQSHYYWRKEEQKQIETLPSMKEVIIIGSLNDFGSFSPGYCMKSI
jgi:hypothetical protein